MKKPSSHIKVLIADDQVLFADNLKLMLETLTEDMEVVDIAHNGAEATEMSLEHKPDVILMDVRMPMEDGVEATKEIKTALPNSKIIMLTMFIDDQFVEAALQYGAEGYLLKNVKPPQLISAIRAVHAGSVLLSPLVINYLKKQEGDKITPEMEEIRKSIAAMGNREKEILNLIAKGYNNKRISETLFISDATVRNYVSSIYAKLGSNDRLEVMSIAKKGINLSDNNN